MQQPVAAGHTTRIGSTIGDHTIRPEPTIRPGLYVAGAAAAVLAIAGSLFDIALTMVPGWDASTVPSDAAGWLTQLTQQPLLGLRNLDLLNMILAITGLPVYLAVAAVHRWARPGLALVAAVFAALGAGLFVAGNAALPMLELARDHASGAAAADQAVVAAAARGLLARGAHGSYGAFPSFFVSEIGTLLTAALMLGGRVFGRVTGAIGLVGTLALMAYSAGITFAPDAGVMVTVVAIPGGLLMVAWYALVARRLLALSRAAVRGER